MKVDKLRDVFVGYVNYDLLLPILELVLSEVCLGIPVCKPKLVAA